MRTGFGWESQKEREREGLRVHVTTMLQRILEKWYMVVWAGFIVAQDRD
jgi:hypothetical protein